MYLNGLRTWKSTVVSLVGSTFYEADIFTNLYWASISFSLFFLTCNSCKKCCVQFMYKMGKNTRPHTRQKCIKCPQFHKYFRTYLRNISNVRSKTLCFVFSDRMHLHRQFYRPCFYPASERQKIWNMAHAPSCLCFSLLHRL